MGAFKLGKMTFGSLFKKPETVLYPFVEKPKPEGLKGHIAIDAESCILCGMCDRSCATGCISVDKTAATWSIDRLQCVQCGYCVTVCPKKCLSMDPNYTKPTTERTVDVVEVPTSPKPAEKASVAESPKQAEPAGKESEEAPSHDGENAGKHMVSAKHAKQAADEQVEALMGAMDPEKAEKVNAALGM